MKSGFLKWRVLVHDDTSRSLAFRPQFRHYKSMSHDWQYQLKQTLNSLMVRMSCFIVERYMFSNFYLSSIYRSITITDLTNNKCKWCAIQNLHSYYFHLSEKVMFFLSKIRRSVWDTTYMKLVERERIRSCQLHPVGHVSLLVARDVKVFALTLNVCVLNMMWKS